MTHYINNPRESILAHRVVYGYAAQKNTMNTGIEFTVCQQNWNQPWADMDAWSYAPVEVLGLSLLDLDLTLEKQHHYNSEVGKITRCTSNQHNQVLVHYPYHRSWLAEWWTTTLQLIRGATAALNRRPHRTSSRAQALSTLTLFFPNSILQYE